MLAVQNEDANYYVLPEDIASLTPVPPDRLRVVLSDGTVTHRPGPMPVGPWAPLQDSRVTPQQLTRDGEHWKDPADYHYAYQPLDPIPAERQETDLPQGLLTLETSNRESFWRTDSGFEKCILKPAQALQRYPQLCALDRNVIVNLKRVRRYGQGKAGAGWLKLDNGEVLQFSSRRTPAVCQALGIDSLYLIQRSQPPCLLKLRDFPYDLTTADPEKIRHDCPTPREFLYGLLWQIVLHNAPLAKDARDLAASILAPAAQRCGYQLDLKELNYAISYLVHDQGVFQLSQLGFAEKDPARRFAGQIYPRVLLFAPLSQRKKALPMCQQLGLNLLLSTPSDDRLPLEQMAPGLPSELHILFFSIKPHHQRTLLRILEQLEIEPLGPPTQLASLDELKSQLENLPPRQPPAPVPFRRIALQAGPGRLLMVDPQEIACWSPTHFGRWRVILVDGQVLHHPGPVPPGPWAELEQHWVQPSQIKLHRDPAGFQIPYKPPVQPRSAVSVKVPAPDQILALQDGPEGPRWHMLDGTTTPTKVPAQEAAAERPWLLKLRRGLWIHHNRIRSTSLNQIQMDGSLTFSVQGIERSTHRLKENLGLYGLDRLAPDPHQLEELKIRDYPFEIARAKAPVLQQHFPTAGNLINNILYQTYDIYQQTGIFPYGNSFRAYFYRPLQATLYRAGFLSGREARSMVFLNNPQDRMFSLFCRSLHNLVRHYRLFTYRQFGFCDPAPHHRLIGSHRAEKILLVEKGDKLEKFARALQAEFGLTLLILAGNPRLLTTEYFAQALKNHGLREIEIYFYGDFDYAGWDNAPAFRDQLLFCGVKCTRLERLILPGCFTAEELPIYSRPLQIANSTIKARVERFMQESGGVCGQARGIHANWLMPYERVRARMEELLR